ncbi:MAG TPA: DNA polymerase III subunit epsilon [Steroidobacteraceae bacterium]|jgi:DNA polymerase-3 subunit epsilon
MRQIVLDTETTGLEAERGHRIIEIGCVELVNRRPSGRHLHHYLNPERDVDVGARAVHGLSRERLLNAPRFSDIVDELLSFVSGCELIMHNAPFDVGFIDCELALLTKTRDPVRPLPASVRSVCTILDTLLLARERHPGQRNNLDALCKRYGIDNSHRELHGALLDARILVDVYLAMTGGQSLLALDEAARELGAGDGRGAPAGSERPAEALRVVEATPEELAAHAQLAALLQKSSGGECLWSKLVGS